MAARFSESLRLVWVCAAMVTVLYAGRVWLRIRHLGRTQAARGATSPTRRWLGVHVRIAGGLTLVGALNLASGLAALSIPPRAPARFPPRDRAGWAALLVPAFFVASAVVKATMARNLDTAYRAVVGRTALRPAA